MKGLARLATGATLGVGAWLGSRALRERRRISFLGRVVVITGASRGLGLVLARRFADEGAKLALLARSNEDLERAEQELRERGAEVTAITCDVADEAQVNAAIQQILDRWGRVDVLINNAGIIQVGPLEHMTQQDFQDSIAIHFWGPYHAMQAVVPHMRGTGGRIVNITSIGGKIAVPHLAPYTAGKFALVGLSDAFRAELRKDKIYVTTVAPGLMRTGSPPNALFKGRHQQEYAWFAIGDALPGLSIDADRAAFQIIEACRYGDPALTITLPAKLAAAANNIAPNVVGHITALVNLLLPRPTSSAGDQARSGWESQSAAAPSLLTKLSDHATVENNQMRGDEPGAERALAANAS